MPSTGTAKAPNHYTTLGVVRTASDEQIRKAYRILVKRWHPDLASPKNRAACEERTKQLNIAYDCLSDPLRRAEHDRTLVPEASASGRASGARRTPRPGASATGVGMTPQQYASYMDGIRAQQERMRDLIWELGTVQRSCAVTLPSGADVDKILGGIDRELRRNDLRTYSVERQEKRGLRLFGKSFGEASVITFTLRGNPQRMNPCVARLRTHLKKFGGKIQVG